MIIVERQIAQGVAVLRPLVSKLEIEDGVALQMVIETVGVLQRFCDPLH